MQFHERLKKFRKQEGLTQEALAEALHVSRSAVAKWENGLGLPSDDSLNDIAAYFGVSREELLPNREEATNFIEKSDDASRMIKNMLLLCLGFLYIALGICTPLFSMIGVGSSLFFWELFSLFFACLGSVPVAFGIILMTMAIRGLRCIRKEKKAKEFGIYAMAKIVGYRQADFLGRRYRRFSLTLTYVRDCIEKTFRTEALFDICEFHYLLSLEQIKVKVYKNFVVVAEPFPEDIDSNPQYRPPSEPRSNVLSILLRIVSILCAAAVLFMPVSWCAIFIFYAVIPFIFAPYILTGVHGLCMVIMLLYHVIRKKCKP